MPLTSCTAVKTNPLFLSPGHREEGDTSRQKCEAYLLLQETPVFFGQRRIIRKTKEQEVAMAVTSIKGKGGSIYGIFL